MSWLRTYGVSAAVLVGLICGATMVAADDTARLTKVLNTQCKVCHVEGGKGGPIKREDLAYSSDSYITGVILNGLPDKGMEANSATLSAEDAAWLAGELRKGALE